MKILFLHALADPAAGGGAEETLWTKMRALRDAGHECLLLATADGGGLQRGEQEGITIWKAGIRNLYWPYHKARPHPALRALWHAQDSYNPWMQGYIREVVQHEQPDVASLHNLPGWSAAAWRTLHRMRVPMVQVLHDYYPLCIKASMYRGGHNCSTQCMDCRALRLPHRDLSRLPTGVVGVSAFILERHRQFGYFEGVPIQRVIHNARDAAQLGVRSAVAAPPHAGLRIGYIGRLDPAKGIEPLIAAFLQADMPNSELWIAGSGKQDYEQHLRGLIRDSRIRLLGRQRPAEFYPQVDVVAVPSLWNDNLPGVVFEAFAFGKPVIGARRGGIPEMIRDGDNGWLVEPTDVAALAALLRSLHARPDMLIAAAQAASAASAPYTDLGAWVQRYEDLYREAISIQHDAPGDARP